MKTITTTIRRFVHDEQGVTAIEYGLLAALVGVAIITAAAVMGTKISDLFTAIANKLGAASVS
ncbi:MAG: Flp family type IVb pilin [Deltaproteobacteria bacterium]|nr:Flp family type IVb pilin [Deltaproteobacteria bacterium]